MQEKNPQKYMSRRGLLNPFDMALIRCMKLECLMLAHIKAFMLQKIYCTYFLLCHCKRFEELPQSGVHLCARRKILFPVWSNFVLSYCGISHTNSSPSPLFFFPFCLFLILSISHDLIKASMVRHLSSWHLLMKMVTFSYCKTVLILVSEMEALFCC